MNNSTCNSEGSELENYDSSKRNYTAIAAALIVGAVIAFVYNTYHKK
jgi:cell division protein FtsN